jgi:hypothetical protein
MRDYQLKILDFKKKKFMKILILNMIDILFNRIINENKICKIKDH